MKTSAFWLEPLTPDVSVDVYRELALTHALSGGPVGWKIAEYIRANDLFALCNFEFAYDVNTVLGHSMAEEKSDEEVRENPRLRARYIRFVRECRQALAYFQKLDFLEIGIDKEEVALGKFLEAEKRCYESNAIFRLEREGKFMFPLDVGGVLYTATQKIARVLGRVPTLGELDFRFGPGATRLTKRLLASVRAKVRERPSCSEDLVSTVRWLLEELPAIASAHSGLDRVDEDGQEWALVVVEIVTARLGFVPKNAKTYRTVIVEAGLNVLIQLAYGAWIGKRLAAFGIDITDQTVNQRRACEGSLTGALATLDLVSASDMEAKELVYTLFPLDWATALGRARSSAVILPTGEVIRQEKFSSMGNGFTFPLQTLTFWALAAACCDKESDATVYGDDIVVPSDRADFVKKVLHCVGFTVNVRKSYSTGPFRESCGKDYVWGIDVRPTSPTGLVTGQSLFTLHNFYKRRGDEAMASKVESYIHPSLRLYGPDGFGDGVLVSNLPLAALPKRYLDRGYNGSFFAAYVTTGDKDAEASDPAVEEAVALYSVYRRGVNPPFLPERLWEESLIDWKSDKFRFLAKYQKRAIGPRYPVPLSIPEKDDGTKQLTLPGVTGYKKIKIYTLSE